MNLDSPDASTMRKASPFRALNVATALFVVAWLAAACYALAHLIFH